MVKLTVQDIIEIHLAVEQRYNFKHFEKGIRNKGLLELIAERPYLKLYGYEPFPDIYFKCASLIEGLTKLHPFINGNKRTALATAGAYMNVNGYKIAIPFPAVKYS